MRKRQIKRYAPCDMAEWGADMSSDVDGEWVRADDVAKEIRKAIEENGDSPCCVEVLQMLAEELENA